MTDLKRQLDNKKDFQQYLYSRGYLVTTKCLENINEYPFYGNWTVNEFDDLYIYSHKAQNVVFYRGKTGSYFLIGHAYNPFTMEHKEDAILKELDYAVEKGNEFEKINELSGQFLIGKNNNKELRFFGDASCILTAYYGEWNNEFYVSSHSQLLGDICGLEQTEYIKKLVNYKYYRLFGKMLPGDLSPYSEFKHTIPNFIYTYSKASKKTAYKRFWPLKKINQNLNQSDEEYKKNIEKVSELLSNSLLLITKKWAKPAISLTGGCDSKTTLACANGLYEKFSYYSYISSEAEKVDAEAAEKICGQLGLVHRTDIIPTEESAYKDLDLWRKLFEQNCGNIGKNNENDIKKRIYYINHCDFDVEVKSWVSETARAYYLKRFDNYRFPKKPTPRYLSAMYKVFLGNRSLLKETDSVFSEFLKKYYSDDVFTKINWVDLIFWEYRVSSWNSLVISNEQSVSYDIIIPYNNRKLLEMLLSASVSCRVNDSCHKDIQKKMNEKIYESGISVTNLKHTNLRAKAEKAYLRLRTI